MKASVVDVATWAFGHEYLDEYITMTEEIGHICLGLTPISQAVELSTVRLDSFLLYQLL